MSILIRKINLEKLYVIFSLIFGIAFVFSNGPFQSPDEYTHFRRAYQISDGNILGEKFHNKSGAFIPQSIDDTVIKVSDGIPGNVDKKVNINNLLEAFNMPLDSKNKIFISSPNTLTYPPIAYIPQSIGISFGKKLNLSPLILMYLGRMFNLFFSCLVILLSMKIIPCKKNLIFLFALMPMVLYQSASLSADGVTNSMAIFTVSYFMRLFSDNTKNIISKNIVTMFLLICILSLTKGMYFLFSFLYLLIPKNKFKDKKQYFMIGLIIIITPLILNVIWSLLTTNTLATNSNASVNGQINYILHNPLSYIMIFFKTLIHNGTFYLKSFIGTLGWLDTDLPLLLTITYYILLIIAAIVNNEKGIFNFKSRVVFICLFLSITTLIFTALYISYTPVGKSQIDGVQGRYLIPIALLLILPLENLKIKIKRFNVISVLYSLSVLICTEYILINRYFIK